MTGAPAAEVAASNLLMDGALMLGAALVFVTIFRKLGLGATLGSVLDTPADTASRRLEMSAPSSAAFSIAR